MAIRGLDAVSGQPIFIESFSGIGSQEDPYVMQRADPITHGKLDQIKAAVDTSNTSWMFHTNFGGSASQVVKNVAGRLRSFVLTNDGAETCYLLFFNSGTVPQAGATDPVIPPFPIHTTMTIAFGQSELGPGFPFSTGISYGISSTRGSYTAIATPGDIRLLVGYQ